MARYGTAGQCTARNGTARHGGTAPHGAAARGSARRSTAGAAQRSTKRHGTARHEAARHGTTRNGTARHDTKRRGTARHTTARHDTTRHCQRPRATNWASLALCSGVSPHSIVIFLREKQCFLSYYSPGGLCLRTSKVPPRTRKLPNACTPQSRDRPGVQAFFSRATPESQSAAGGWRGGGALVRYLTRGAAGGWSGCVAGGKCTSERFSGFARKSSVSRKPKFFVV